jgi:hypothetical protein
MALLQVCKISIPDAAGNGVSTYYFRTGKNVYKGDLAAATGVTEAPVAFDHDEPLVSIAELILSGKIMRFYATCQTGAKKVLREVLVRIDKVEEVFARPGGSLQGKTLGNAGVIKAVRSRTMDAFK